MNLLPKEVSEIVLWLNLVRGWVILFSWMTVVVMQIIMMVGDANHVEAHSE